MTFFFQDFYGFFRHTTPTDLVLDSNEDLIVLSYANNECYLGPPISNQIILSKIKGTTGILDATYDSSGIKKIYCTYLYGAEPTRGLEIVDSDNVWAGYTTDFSHPDGLGFKLTLVDETASIISDTFSFLNPATAVIACSVPDGYVENSDDCNDSEASLAALQTFYLDLDADGYGINDVTILSCSLTPPLSYAAFSNDCAPYNTLLTLALQKFVMMTLIKIAMDLI